MEPLAIILAFALAGSGGFAFYLFNKLEKLKKEVSEQPAESIDEIEAIKKASEIAKQKIIEAEQAALKTKNQLKEQEKLLDEREEKLVKKNKQLDSKLDQLEKKEEQVEAQKKQLRKDSEEINTKLQEVAKMTQNEAETLLKKEVEAELGDWISRKVRESEEEISEKKKDTVKSILVESMIQGAVEYVAETTTTTIDIQDESMKSRIIGKSGRNVRAFERLTGVDVIIDESATEVTLSCFDPIRREVAAIALKKLVKTGKINPATIEETIEKVKKDILKEIRKTGENAAFEAGVGELNKELLMLLGRYKYRFIHGQNLLKHTLEMVKIGSALAKELRADEQTVKLACLLAGIGKVAPKEGKSYEQVSAEIVSKYYNNKALINALASMKDEIETTFIEGEILKIVEQISKNRPGAKVDSYEDYIKRMRNYEDVVKNYKGIAHVYAIQSGREVRVIVEPSSVNDEDTKTLAYKIAREIDEKGISNSPVKVTVIREQRFEKEAK